MPLNFSDRLNEWRKDETPVVVSTVTEEEFTGIVEWFDNYNISLDTEEGEVVLFKGGLVYIREVDEEG